jgi:hypothetical protein
LWTSSGNLSLAAFAGDTIRLRFTFNTVDSAANTFTGWFIDDVKVTGGASCPAPIRPLFEPFASVPLPAAFAPLERR